MSKQSFDLGKNQNLSGQIHPIFVPQPITYSVDLWHDASINWPLCSAFSLHLGAGKKRAAAEGARGAPVNKRKSLLMKPRHYSPSPCPSEGDGEEDLASAQDKDAPRNTDTPAGRQMSCCFVCFDEQLTLNFKLPSVAFIYLFPSSSFVSSPPSLPASFSSSIPGKFTTVDSCSFIHASGVQIKAISCARLLLNLD